MTDATEPAMMMIHDCAEFTVAELRDRAGEDAFGRAGVDVVDMDGPHEDEQSLYATLTLHDGRELETILHHRAGRPLTGECSCTAGSTNVFCAHLVWVGLTHLELADEPPAAWAAEAKPGDDLRAWLRGLTTDELIELVVEAADDNDEYRHRLHLRAGRP